MTNLLLNQGATRLCGEYAILQAFTDRGRSVSLSALYMQMHGKLFDGLGDLTSFEQLQAGVLFAAQSSGTKIELYHGDGYVYDLATFDQLVRDGWAIICGVQMSVLVPGQDYGHFFYLPNGSGIHFDNGVPFVNVEDTYALYDGDTGTLPLPALHAAMQANWTGPTGQDALAWKWL